MTSISASKWSHIKYSKHSLIEYSEEPKALLPFLISNSEEHQAKESLLKDYFSYLNNSFLHVKEHQTNALICALVLFLLTLALYLSLSSFLIASTTIVFLFRFYVQNLNSTTLSTMTSTNTSYNNLKGIIKISSIYQCNAKDVVSYVNNMTGKAYLEWNLYLKSATKVNENVRLVYANKEESSFIINRRMQSEYTFIDTIIDEKSSTHARVTVIESSGKGDKTRVSVYLHLKGYCEGRITSPFIQSNLKSLNLLHLLISRRNFNLGNDTVIEEEDEEEEEEKDKDKEEVNAIQQTIANKRGSIATIVSAVKVDTTIRENEFQEFDNKFSEAAIDPLVQKENEDIIATSRRQYATFSEFLNKPWKVLEEKTDSGYKAYYFDEPTGLRSIKSEIMIEKNIKTVWDFLVDFNTKGKYDKNFDCGHNIREIDSTYTLQYLKYKGKLFISPRDFTIVSMKKYEENKGIIFATSYNSEKYPKVKAVERAELVMGGFIIKAIEDSKTLMTYFTLSDIKLSQSLVNVSLKEVAYQVKIFRDLVMAV